MGAVKQDVSGWSLLRSMQYISKQSSGVLLLLGDSFYGYDIQKLVKKYYASGLRQQKTPTHVNAKSNTYNSTYRNIGTGAQILRYLGVTKMRLLSTPIRFNAISGFYLKIVEYVSYQQK